MARETKPKRRTRERIVETSLALFNQFGAPNVTTTVIADELDISPGNLYYHFSNKDEIINTILAQFEREIEDTLAAPAPRPEAGDAAPATAGPDHAPVGASPSRTGDALRPDEPGDTRAAADVEDIWLFLHVLFEIIWKYRFFYRDLTSLVSENRTLEMRFKQILSHKVATSRALCEGLVASGEMTASPREIDALGENMVLIATYWLSFAFARDPRAVQDGTALSRGVYHVMALVAPFLAETSRRLFERLAEAYIDKGSE